VAGSGEWHGIDRVDHSGCGKSEVAVDVRRVVVGGIDGCFLVGQDDWNVTGAETAVAIMVAVVGMAIGMIRLTGVRAHEFRSTFSNHRLAGRRFGATVNAWRNPRAQVKERRDQREGDMEYAGVHLETRALKISLGSTRRERMFAAPFVWSSAMVARSGTPRAEWAILHESGDSGVRDVVTSTVARNDP
jgi:hypothetical protein